MRLLRSHHEASIHRDGGALLPRASIWVCSIFLFSLQADTCSAQIQGDLVQYFNLSLPGMAPRTPIVLAASAHRTIVAREFYGDDGRDIQVLVGDGEHWDFLGDNGDAITEIRDCQLVDAKQGPDGRLWLVACNTDDLNPFLRKCDYLYCYEEDTWRLIGKHRWPEERRAYTVSLHFLGSNEPVVQYSNHLESIVDLPQQHIARFEEMDRATSSPLETLLKQHRGLLAWRENDAWYLVPTQGTSSTDFNLYRLKGKNTQDIIGPIRLPGWSGKVALDRFAVSSKGSLAVLGLERVEQDRTILNDENSTELRTNVQIKRKGLLYRPIGEARFAVEKMEMSPLTSVCSWGWSSKDILFATEKKDPQTIEIFALETGSWKKKGEGHHPGILADPLLFFRSDGEPIVVWEDGFLCGGMREGEAENSVSFGSRDFASLGEDPVQWLELIGMSGFALVALGVMLFFVQRIRRASVGHAAKSRAYSRGS